MHTRWICSCVIVLATLLTSHIAAAQNTAFTYQGQLKRGGSPTTGMCDFQFGLFDVETGGTQIDNPQLASDVTVTNGLFTVPLDFNFRQFRVSGDSFFGADRWLEISVRCPAGSGNFSTLLPRQLLTVAPFALYAPLVARDPSGTVRASVDVVSDGSGVLRAFGPNGETNVEISSTEEPNHGFVSVDNENGDTRVEVSVLASGAGFVSTVGPNGNDNTRLTFLTANPDHGFISVQDSTGTSKAGIFVNESGQGEIFADVKDFVVDHPTRPGSKIVYASLEGPEAAIYHRGVVKLTTGRAAIELPEHFTALANPDTITVQLTPRSFDSQGLGFGAIHDGRIEIRELHKGKGSYDVHFVVHALRRGFEDRRPVLAGDEFDRRFSARAPGNAAMRGRRDIALQTPSAQHTAE